MLETIHDVISLEGEENHLKSSIYKSNLWYKHEKSLILFFFFVFCTVLYNTNDAVALER